MDMRELAESAIYAEELARRSEKAVIQCRDAFKEAFPIGTCVTFGFNRDRVMKVSLYSYKSLLFKDSVTGKHAFTMTFLEALKDGIEIKEDDRG